MRQFLTTVLVTALVVVLSTQIVAAQAWRDAVIVLANGDSVRGQIEFTDPDVSATRFQFRNDAGSAPVTYSTDHVTSFSLIDPPQHFKKLEVQVTYYSKGVVAWGGNPILGITRIVAFAEVIRASRSIALYSLHDADRKERFFIRKGNELTELKEISYMVERNSTTFRVHESPYEGQLKGLLADCLGPQKKQLSYDSRSLGKAVDAYIVCKGEAASSSANRPPHELLTIGGFFLVGAGTEEGEPTGWGGTFGVNAQLLSRKNRGNQFLWIDVGAGSPDILALPIYFGVFAGSYFGQGRVQPFFDVGVTTLIGTFNGGLGVAYKKRVILGGNINTGFIGDRATLYTIKLAVFPRVRRR